ncbi:transposable element Tcb2 transposase [Trichonephila clavipes]|nr:transposable element Tcb2 transposase [Trichonephila clavipes]
MAWWLNYGLGCFINALFGIFGACTNLSQSNSVRRVSRGLPPSVYVVLLSDGNGVFQPDNCTSHKSHLVTGWLVEHYYDFSVKNWPPRNPDSYSIEHPWDVLEQGLKDHHTVLMNLTELWTALATIWKVITVERFQKLVEYIPRRVAVVIKARRGTTRY